MATRILHHFCLAFIVTTLALVSITQANIYVSFESLDSFSQAAQKYSGSGIKAFPENRTLEIYAVPLEFRGNSRTFSPVAAFLVSEEIARSNQTIQPIVLARVVYPDSNASSFEVWAVRTAGKLSPVALLAHSGAFGTGGYQVNKIYEDDFTTAITVPVVHISSATATNLIQILNANNGILNVTITDWPANDYMERKSGAVFVFYSVLLCTWALLIIILAIIAMVRRGVGRNLGTLCLILDIVGACVRLVWGLDPFAGRFLPAGVLETLYTGSLPIVLSGTIILLLFWHELATQVSLQVSGVLEKKTKPAVISICVLFIAEIVSASLRSSRQFYSDVALTVVVVIYLITALAMAIYFIYVFVIVSRFLQGKVTGRSGGALRTCSIRAIFCVAGLFTIIGVTV
eukprot:TRINITY_DN3259_c0_g1_i2.p1 TRINITY_DN3259_c0_g1~~TRINITY_DN3259_c0_g1_i2.p1  ORF type:complete len:402 (+),score=46.04 TRINITY_DN3259_c0_g1_i2:106-1311(+)